MKYYGCAYYPEYWGQERFETDAKLMREAGINLARIGEFAWSRMEPREGEFTLDWLKQCVDTLGRYGVKTMLCTPTATPPAWLAQAYPESLLMKFDGRRLMHGDGRRHYCPTSPVFRRLYTRVIERLAEEFKGNPNVVAWQIDNELGPHETGWCHCENCQDAFQQWLGDRYGTVEELNRRWATGFWSMDYASWSQVRLGAVEGRENYPSRMLDTRRFVSDSYIRFAHDHAMLIRRHQPDAAVTTNGMGPIFPSIDYYMLFSGLDTASDDLYFDIGTQNVNAMAMDVFRSIKPGRSFWITETGSGALDCNKPPRREQLHAWLWSSFARGCEAYVIFRWRTCLSGQEQELQGILEHCGLPGHRYRSVKSAFTGMRKALKDIGDLPPPLAKIAIVQDYECLFTYDSAVIGKEVNYQSLIVELHKRLYDRGLSADVVPPDRPLGQYSLVILPSLVTVGEALAASLHEYVRGGGVVLAWGQIAMRDANMSYLPAPGPGGLRDLFGVETVGGMYLKSHAGAAESLWPSCATDVRLKLEGAFGGKPRAGEACVWAADMRSAGAETLLRIACDDYAGQPAVTGKKTGNGVALFCGALALDDALAGELLEYALGKAGIKALSGLPAYVEVVARGDAVIVVNHRDESVSLGAENGIALPQAMERLELPPFGVCVLRGQRVMLLPPEA